MHWPARSRIPSNQLRQTTHATGKCNSGLAQHPRREAKYPYHMQTIAAHHQGVYKRAQLHDENIPENFHGSSYRLSPSERNMRMPAPSYRNSASANQHFRISRSGFPNLPTGVSHRQTPPHPEGRRASPLQDGVPDLQSHAIERSPGLCNSPATPIPYRRHDNRPR